MTDRVTFSWISAKAMDDSEFRYCLCSKVPGWWHGDNTKLCVGVSCVMERRRGSTSRIAHIRLPEAFRKFELADMTKEGLLHALIHCFVFVTHQTLDTDPFASHGALFQSIAQRLNNGASLTQDVFRPTEGYHIEYGANAAMEREASRLQSLLDAVTLEHLKVLYIASKYSQFAERASDPELWVWRTPLLVRTYTLIAYLHVYCTHLTQFDLERNPTN